MPKEYSPEDLKSAVLKVQKGFSLRKASKLTNVPVSTIKDHSRGNYRNKITKRGGIYALNDKEENTLCNYIRYMGSRGFPLTRKVVRKLAFDIVKQSGRPCLFNSEKGPSHKWLRNFLKRHKEISVRKPHGLETVRSDLKPEEIANYYSILDETLTRLGIKDDPSRIFNFDETGFSSKMQGREKIIVQKGVKHPYQPIVSVNGHVTLQLAISANGNAVAPLIIYSKNLPRDSFVDGVPENWTFAYSDSGFINNQILLSWFKESFSKQCSKYRPVLVVMDNHVTHLNKELIDFAQEDQIELLCLPPHSTHLLQPLDVGYYHLLKENFTNMSVALGYTGMKSVPRHKFPKLLHLAMNRISGSSISSAFSCVGICPFNPAKVSNCSPKKILNEKSVEIKDCEKCITCGHVNSGDKLVKLGIIPEELKTLFVDPPEKEKGKSVKRRLEARVLTCIDLKKVRCTNKAIPCTTKAVNGMTHDSGPATTNGSTREDEVVCEVCMTGSNELTWIGCDNCERWLHYECVGRKQQKLIDKSLKYKTKWLCNSCLLEE